MKRKTTWKNESLSQAESRLTGAAIRACDSAMRFPPLSEVMLKLKELKNAYYNLDREIRMTRQVDLLPEQDMKNGK